MLYLLDYVISEDSPVSAVQHVACFLYSITQSHLCTAIFLSHIGLSTPSDVYASAPRHPCRLFTQGYLGGLNHRYEPGINVRQSGWSYWAHPCNSNLYGRCAESLAGHIKMHTNYTFELRKRGTKAYEQELVQNCCIQPRCFQ